MCELESEILTFTDQEKSCLYYYFDSEAIFLMFELLLWVFSHCQFQYVVCLT